MLNFGNSNGLLFNRIGKLGLLVKQVRSYQTSQSTNFTNGTNGVAAQYVADIDLQAAVSSAWPSLINSAGSSVGSLARTVCQATINRMVYKDNPQLNQNLTNINLMASVKEVIRQMKMSGASVLQMTIAATPSAFAGSGNGVIVTSVKRPLDGLVLENTFAEGLLLTCKRDSYTGGAIAGNETLSIVGDGAQTDFFAADWPLGSNSSSTASVINGNANGTQGNFLNNSGFETWAANVPKQFTLDVGNAGTNIFQESSLVYDAANALRLAGDGATLTQLRQQFGISTGTTSKLQPLTQYGFNIFIRRDGVAAAQGVLAVELVDQNGSIINDANGVANQISISLTGLNTAYAAYNGAFRTPNILPTTSFLRLRLTTALTNGRSVYLDKMSMGTMSQLYTSGPFLSVHAGSVPFSAALPQPDYASVAVTNSRGSGGTISTFQTLWAQLVPQMIGQELLLPSVTSNPTLPDSLIG